MLKNILATVGAFVIVKKWYEVYRHYKAMEMENELLRMGQGPT